MLFDNHVIKPEVNNRKKNQENLQTLNIYIRKKTLVNNLSFHFNKLEKEEKISQKKQKEENNKK